MRRTLEFSHQLPRRTERPGVECLARTAMRIEDPARQLAARCALPDLQLLGEATGEFRAEPFPLRLEQLLAEPSADEVPLEVSIPAQVQSWLERRAPMTWNRLCSSAHVLQRGEAFRIARTDGVLEIDHRPEGASNSSPLRCPLLELASALGAGVVPGLSSTVKRKDLIQEAELLVREVLRSRWVTRRLPPGIAWGPEDGAFYLRHSAGVRLREVPSEGQPELPGTLLLDLDEHVQAFGLNVDPHDELPLDVLRGALPWLLDLAGGNGELFLDPSGRTPR